MNKFVFSPSSASLTGSALKSNIQNWMTSALKDNPGIISHLWGYCGMRPTPTADDKKLVSWYNEFTGKLLCGMAQSYAAMPTEELKAAGDELCRALADAQCDDGYLGIYSEAERFGSDGENWDLWGHYHIICGLCSWSEYTGSKEAEDTALRAADCVWRTFSGSGRSYDSAKNQTMNLSVSHAFAELYKKYKTEKFRDAAIDIVERDWRLSGNWMIEALEGLDFYKSSLPRWEALHTVMTLASLYDITGEDKYYDALSHIWHSIRRTDVHNTGGFSSGEQASGDPFAGGDIETCCTVAWMALSCEYLRLSKNVAAADALERAHFNAMLGSLMPDGRYVTYSTPMWGEGRHPSQHVIGFQYNSASKEFNCCQANCARGLSQFTQWATLRDGSDIFVNMYSEGAVHFSGIHIEQHTDYPIDGDVLLELYSENEPATVHLRIPGWASGVSLEANGKKIPAEPGSYAAVKLAAGERVEAKLKIPMEIYAEQGGGALEGAVSLYRGPILLTSDGMEAAAAVKELPCGLEELKNARLCGDGKHFICVRTGDVELFDFASCKGEAAYTSWHYLRKS